MNEERPIEKLLRRYAKKRRDEAGPARELHPATRRMLQSEVERQFPKPASKEGSAFDEFVAGFARRWIYAVGVFVVLLVAAVMLPTLSKSKSKTNLALNKSTTHTEAMMPSESAASVAAPASVAMDELAFAYVTNGVANLATGSLADNRNEDSARRRLGADRDVRSGGGNFAPASDSGIAPSSAPVAEGLAASSAVAKRDAGEAVFSEYLGASRNLSVAKTASPDLSIVKSKGSVADALIHDKNWLARGGGAQEKDAQNYSRQSFANDQPVLAKKAMAVSGEAKAIAPVLANFQIEQSGNKLRVIDGDGSTYHGEVGPEQSYGLAQNAAFKNDGEASLAGELRAKQQKQMDGEYQFRVAGTNRTLNQQVVFTWNCVPITNALAFSNNSFAAREIKKFDAAKMPQQFPGLQNSYINGRAQIASEKEIEINARPVSE